MSPKDAKAAVALAGHPPLYSAYLTGQVRPEDAAELVKRVVGSVLLAAVPETREALALSLTKATADGVRILSEIA